MPTSLWSNVLSPTTLSSTDTDICVGESVTFAADVPDASAANPVTNVPWQIFFNGDLLGEENLQDYVILDPSIGPSLADWSLQTVLTFTALEPGCYTVGVLDFISLTSTNQEILPAEIRVAGAPNIPLFSGFDQLLCAGETNTGLISSFTVGEIEMSLNFNLEGPSGFNPISSTAVGVGEACDGPSVNMTFPATTLDVPGAYVLAASASNACGTTADTLLIEVVAPPAFGLTTNPICSGADAIVFSDVNNTTYLNSLGEAPTLSAVWSSSGGTNASSATFPSPSNGDQFTQSVSLTYGFLDFETTCTGEATISQVVYTPEPAALLFEDFETIPDFLCEGEELVVTISNNDPEGPEATYTWATTPLPNDISADGLTYSWDAVDFDISIEVTQSLLYDDGFGTTCVSAPLTIDVPVSEMPVIGWASSSATACEGETATLVAEVLSSVGSSTTLAWTSDFGSGTGIVESETTSFELNIPIPSSETSGSSVVTLMPTDNIGCTGASIEGLIEYYVAPEPTGFVDALCEGEDVEPNGLLTGPGLSYNWIYNGAVSSGPSPVFTDVTCDSELNLVMAQSYLIDGTALSCSSDPYAFDLNITPLPAFDLVIPDATCDNTELTLTVNENNQTSGCIAADASYDWTIDTGSGPINFDNVSTVVVGGSDYDEISIVVTGTQTSVDNICTSEVSETITINSNPEVNLANTNIPGSICVGSTVNVSSSLLPGTGTGSGQQMTYSWTNSDDPEVFDIQLVQGGSAAVIAVSDIQNIPDQGHISFNITDTNGCTAQETFTIDIVELPVFGDLTAVTPIAACSGTSFNLELSEVSVDNGLDAADLVLTWEASMDSQLEEPTIVTDGTSATITPFISEVAFQDFVAPEPLNVSVTADIGGCSNTANFNAVVEVYPLPLREADNNNVCVGQDWVATVTGCEVLTVYGEAPNPDITWTTDDPAIGIDVVLPQSYMQPPTGQTQQTFDFYAGVTYTDVGLTCFNEKPFGLFRRQAPNFSVNGEDSSGPLNDLVLCEGENVTLNSFINQNGASEAFSWAQYVDDSDGNSILEPLSSNTFTALFVDVAPSEPFDQATLVEGVAYVTYTYNQAPGFECVVEEPWSFQIMPTPEVAWDLTQSHVCDGDNNNVAVSLSAGATSLNGEGISWNWDWSSSTFTGTLTTADPNDVVAIESQYEPTLDGMFEQTMMVTVTDSYGCISNPSSQNFFALERAVVELERPFICAVDTLEVLASGADVYEWDVDPTSLNGALEPQVYFPNYVSTGDSLQTLVLFDPEHGDIVGVTGALVYSIDPDSTVLCSASNDINLVVFDMPVLDMTFAVDEAPYCEGDVVTFEDTNTDGGNVVYDYWTSTGIDETQVTDNVTTFVLQSDTTIFEVTKYESNAIQGVQTICSVMETQVYAVIANPVISVDGTPGICQDGVGNVICEVNDHNSAFTYSPVWTASANATAAESQPSNSEFVLTVGSADGVTVEPSESLVFSVYVKDDNGCNSETLSFDMEVVATPILLITDSLMPEHCSPAQDCMQVDLLNVGLGADVDVLYFWDNEPGGANDGYCVNFINPTNCPFVDSTNVTVRYEHMLTGGETVFCLSGTMDSTVVNPTPEPFFTLDAPQACLDLNLGNCVPFEHDTTAYDLCSDDSLSFEWFVTPLGDLIQNDLSLSDLNTPFPTVCIDTAGVLNVVLEITNAYGCSQTTANVPFTVRGLPVPELTFEQPSICLPTTVSVLNSSAGASDFTMSIPGYPTFENFLSPLVLDIEFPGYYNAEFEVSNTHFIDGHEVTCSVDTEYVAAFEGRTPPVAEFAVLPDTLIDFVNPVVEFINLSEGQTENIWSFGNGEGSSELDPEVEYEAAGIYNAQLLVKNEYGCTDVHSQEIEVYTDLYIYVPNSFTPNNDGLNDAWLPSIIGQDVIATYECSVFNRTGDRVFFTNDPNKPWIGGNDLSGDGMHYTSGGEVFAWRISIKKKDGQGAKVYTGHVTMVR